MTRDVVVDLTVQALELGLKVCLPLLGVGLVVGLVVSVLQAVTQIQEMTLSFIPKLLASAVVLVVAGPWMIDQLVAYAGELYSSIPEVTGP